MCACYGTILVNVLGGYTVLGRSVNIGENGWWEDNIEIK
jgi:hypothetical protein